MKHAVYSAVDAAKLSHLQPGLCPWTPLAAHPQRPRTV